MKRKDDRDREMLSKLQRNIEKLLAAAERLAAAADHGRRQIDRLSDLIAQVEESLRRGARRGISIESEEKYDPLHSVNLGPETEAGDTGEEHTVNFGFGHFVEFSSYEELKKFQKLPPISGDDIEECDFEEIIRRLLADTDDST